MSFFYLLTNPLIFCQSTLDRCLEILREQSYSTKNNYRNLIFNNQPKYLVDQHTNLFVTKHLKHLQLILLSSLFLSRKTHLVCLVCLVYFFIPFLLIYIFIIYYIISILNKKKRVKIYQKQLDKTNQSIKSRVFELFSWYVFIFKNIPLVCFLYTMFNEC